jgi:hypothetical protein
MPEHDTTLTAGRPEAAATGPAPSAATGTGETAAAAPAGSGPGRRIGAEGPLMQVRASDVQPYTGLGYLSKLFRLIAIFLVLLLVLEIVTGLYREGTASLPTLLSEVSRLVVLAGLLWGAGDLANLLIDIGHDVRAARILLGRQAAHAGDRVGERLGERGTASPPGVTRVGG